MRRRSLWASSVFAWLLASAGFGDWLITESGERIETRGPWKVNEARQLVLFHLPDGALSSLRLSDVDLEASRKATEEAQRPSAVSATPQREEPVQPVLVLTDADVRKAEPLPSEPEEGDAQEPAGSEQERLTVSSWSLDEPAAFDGVRVRGRIANTSSELVTGATLQVDLLDAEGEILFSETARLTTTALPSGASANFVAEFPGVYNYASVEMKPSGFAVETSPEEGEEGSPTASGDG